MICPTCASAALVVSLLACSPVLAAPSTAEQAREEFLAAERIARLPAAAQAEAVPRLYREIAPRLSMFVEGIVSTFPARLLERDRPNARDAGPEAVPSYARQLEEAAQNMTAEEVVDVIAKTHGTLIVRVAARRRCMQVLENHRMLVVGLVQADLDSGEASAVKRGYHMIAEMRLREFTDRVVKAYLGREPEAKLAWSALVWLNDPRAVEPIAAEVQKDPPSLQRHALLLQGMLAQRRAHPVFVKLLGSPDSDIRSAATLALAKCTDESLAPYALNLLNDKDGRVRSAAVEMAFAQPEATFPLVRPALVKLLDAPEVGLRTDVACGLARRGDAVAAPVLLGLWKLDAEPAESWRVMQAVAQLTHSTFGYNLHRWGPLSEENQAAIRKLEEWIAEHVRP